MPSKINYAFEVKTVRLFEGRLLELDADEFKNEDMEEESKDEE
jgi:hypothetical protein